MPAPSLETTISLPPGAPSSDSLLTLLRKIFEEYEWFEPVRYGLAAADSILQPGFDIYGSFLEYYEARKSLCIAAQTDRDFLCIFPSKPDTPPYKGRIIWCAPSRKASRVNWRRQHAKQVVDIMRLVGSPLAIAGLEEDIQSKTDRWAPGEFGEKLTFTVRDYSEGLAGLFWRNFYGPPFVRLFGERLNALPPECVTRLGEELVLVQPYELPTEAGTEAARAREQQLISLLGPECFYDPVRQRPPTHRPVLPPPPWPAPGT